jgi:hypothetical protein
MSGLVAISYALRLFIINDEGKTYFERNEKTDGLAFEHFAENQRTVCTFAAVIGAE